MLPVPLLVTAEAVPAAHRFAAAGVTKVATPLAEPHAPLVITSKVALTVQVALMLAVAKVLTPAPLAVPAQPLMLTVRYPLAGVAVQFDALPP